jgi:hypothetical protein
MINRLPKEFPLPALNGKHRSAVAAAAADLRRRTSAGAARYIADHPVAVLSAAFIAGLVLGRVVKR